MSKRWLLTLGFVFCALAFTGTFYMLAANSALPDAATPATQLPHRTSAKVHDISVEEQEEQEVPDSTSLTTVQKPEITHPTTQTHYIFLFWTRVFGDVVKDQFRTCEKEYTSNCAALTVFPTEVSHIS